jgi:hypothetical protein
MKYSIPLVACLMFGLLQAFVISEVDDRKAPSEQDLGRIFGEGLPNTYCKISDACIVVSTCAADGKGGCTGHGGCEGPANRVCAYGNTTTCVQKASVTCCQATNCHITRDAQGNTWCVANTVTGGAPSMGSRTDC